MKVLAVDSSGLVASVAVVQDEELIAEYTMNYKKTHSQTLLPMLEEVKKIIDLDLESIDVIAVAAGPGSFTGLRIGSATVKGLGLALNKPIAEVPTLEGLAYNLCGTNHLVCPIMDARREQVYTGVYRFRALDDGWKMETVKPQCAVDIAAIIKELNELNEPVIFLGDGVPVYKEKISQLCNVPYTYAPAGKNRQCATSIAVLGMEYAKQGCVVTAAEHAPEYLRKSQAEREREEANGTST